MAFLVVLAWVCEFGFFVWLRGFFVIEGFGTLAICLGLFVVWLIHWLVWVFVVLLSSLCFFKQPA